MNSEAIAVDVILTLESPAAAENIERAFQFYAATYSDEDNSISYEVVCTGLQEVNRYRLSFLGNSSNKALAADGVHRFMESFLDDFYDESIEDDWLCELGCEELPIIVDYEVEPARAYCPE